MNSIRSWVIIKLIKNRHWFRGRLRQEPIDADFSVENFRNQVDEYGAKAKLVAGVKGQIVDVDGLYAEWLIPENASLNKVLLYIHGGGFISGSVASHRAHVAKFARGSGLRSLLFDYRLAPEQPFPAALEDCVRAYKWLLKSGYEPKDIVIGGESAGGTLTLSLLLALKAEGIELPAAGFAISPVTDLRCLADSFEFNAKNDIAPMGSWDLWTQYYIADNDPTMALLSPLFGNFERLPPLFICVGSYEIHLNDCIDVAKKAQRAGVNVSLRVWPKMVHAFPIMSPYFPEAKAAMQEICNFVSSHLK